MAILLSVVIVIELGDLAGSGDSRGRKPKHR